MATTVETTYEQHRDYVLAVLGRRCGWLNQDDREAVFHDAYAIALEKERDGSLELEAMHPNQLRAYLTQTAINRALDEGKRAERKRTEPIGERALATPDAGATPDEVADRSLEDARVREIVSGLPARRQAIVKLRFFFERTPEEIQRLLAISPRTYRRDLERGLRYVSERFELVRTGNYCDTRTDLILSYIAGNADAAGAREAREHLANCPGCAHWAVEVRETARRVAGFLPLPVVSLESTGRLAEVGVALREAATDLTLAAKQHVAPVLARIDPTSPGYLSAARPGAVVAAVAGCIAVGGGATYCAVQGVPGPGESLLALLNRSPAQDEPNTNRTDPRPERAPALPVAPPLRSVPTTNPRPPVAPPQPPAAAPRPAPAPEPDPAPEAAATAPEFGLEGSGEAVPSSGGDAPAPIEPAPAPAPPEPLPEFDP